MHRSLIPRMWQILNKQWDYACVCAGGPELSQYCIQIQDSSPAATQCGHQSAAPAPAPAPPAPLQLNLRQSFRHINNPLKQFRLNQKRRMNSFWQWHPTRRDGTAHESELMTFGNQIVYEQSRARRHPHAKTSPWIISAASPIYLYWRSIKFIRQAVGSSK